MTGYPDVETLLIDDLDAYGTTGTVTPPDLQAHLPFIRVRRAGGSDNGRSDAPRVDVEVFAATRAIGFGVAETIRDHLIHDFAVPSIDRVTTETGPQELPWEDPDIRRWLVTYRVVTRRR